jgi:hypothetical protein
MSTWRWTHPAATTIVRETHPVAVERASEHHLFSFAQRPTFARPIKGRSWFTRDDSASAVCQKARAMVFRGELAGARDVLDDSLVTSSDSDRDTPFTVLGDLALVEHLQGSFDRALQAGEAFSLSFAATNVGRWHYHKELCDALSTAALGDQVTARHRLSIVVDRLEASPAPPR